MSSFTNVFAHSPSSLFATTDEKKDKKERKIDVDVAKHLRIGLERYVVTKLRARTCYEEDDRSTEKRNEIQKEKERKRESRERVNRRG